MEQRRIGNWRVGAVAFGGMNLSHGYGAAVTPEHARDLVHAALEGGMTMFDTAALYGFGANERLLGPLLKAHRERIVLASKGGMAGVLGADGGMRRVIDGRPETLRRNCEDSLQRLGTEVIDLYYLHRWDQSVPIEESVGAMARLVQEGKVRALGLSEVGAETLRRAHREHPITALQSEYSLWTRNAELGTLQACQELGIAYVAFSPVGRGYLSGKLTDTARLQAGDMRCTMPRFQPENYARNLQLLQPMREVAAQAGCTLAELALAWVLHQGMHVVALPGTTQWAHLQENLRASAVQLTPQMLQSLHAIFAPEAVAGDRYPLQAQSEVDTEKFVFEQTGRQAAASAPC